MKGNVARREFLATAMAAPLAAAQRIPESSLDPDYRSLISRADLVYEKPVSRSEEGVPIGNGRMGSLVWTTPSAMKFQINRVDVYPISCATDSFFERNSDYCGGCGFVDIEFARFGDDVFPESGFRQHLDVCDALLSVKANGVNAHLLAWHQQDVIAVEIDDQRTSPEPISVNLRMLRFESQYHGQQLESMIKDHIVTVRTRNHTAASQLLMRGERIVLTQEFREGEHYNKSAVVIGIVGRPVKTQFADETELRLSVAPGPGQFTVLMSSASSFDPKEDVAETALRQLDPASTKGFAVLAGENQRWWHEFWSRGFVSLHSEDGVADSVSLHYAWFLYLMASTSRGKFPPKFNGMLWNTAGDLRAWGSQHWFANLSCYYEAVPATNRLELLDPAFEMYFGMYENCGRAARQQWGSQGIYIPETCWHDGLAALPEDIAAEMRDLYLLRKPWEQRSARFIEFASTKHPHSSRWNWNQSGRWVDGRWITQDRGVGPYGAVNHIFGTTAKIAYLFWRRYEYTLDVEWLRNRAYPMLKGAVEFYRNYPNFKKEADGKYHIHHVNSNESVLGAQDTDEDLSALRGVLPALIRASEILNVDANLRPVWSEFLANLAPLPDSSHPEALKPADYSGPRVWTRGLRPSLRGGGLRPDGNSMPQWWFDLACVETADKERLGIANATFDAFFRTRIDENTSVGVLSKVAIAAAYLGRADAVRYLIPNQIRVLRQERGTAYRGGGVLANRLTLREGAQALDAQSLGRASEALHLALLQSNPPAPAEAPILRLFPAWPQNWDASFRLAARGGFVIGSRIRSGNIEFVEIESTAGAECRLRNPWGGVEVTLFRDGNKSAVVRGSLLTFPTRKGERIRAVPNTEMAKPAE
jgi:hypothetical protein